jgi:hypothetical protein
MTAINLASVSQRHRVGLFSASPDVYWDQFSGLKRTVEGFNGRVAARLEASGVEVVNLGIECVRVG